MIRDLQQALNEYVAGSKHTLHSVALAAGIGYSTIKRISRGEGEPKFETVDALLSVIGDLEKKKAFLQQHFPRFGEMYAAVYKGDSARVRPVSEEARRFLQREPHNRIFNIVASGHPGIARSYIEKLTGDLGLKALDELLDAGVLVESGETLHYSEENHWQIANVPDLLEQIRKSCGHFDERAIGIFSKLMHQTASVNRETMARLAKLNTDYVAALTEILSEKESEGDIPVFIDLVCSPYDATQIKDN